MEDASGGGLIGRRVGRRGPDGKLALCRRLRISSGTAGGKVWKEVRERVGRLGFRIFSGDWVVEKVQQGTGRLVSAGIR